MFGIEWLRNRVVVETETSPLKSRIRRASFRTRWSWRSFGEVALDSLSE